MDEIAVGVTEYMNEGATKEGEEEPKPNAMKEATSPPRPSPTDVTEANTPSSATSETPPAPQADHPAEALLTDPASS